MVFIDAGHLYDEVKSDICKWMCRLKPHGILCGHDYTAGEWHGVKKVVDELFDKNFTVVQETSIWCIIFHSIKHEYSEANSKVDRQRFVDGK